MCWIKHLVKTQKGNIPTVLEKSGIYRNEYPPQSPTLRGLQWQVQEKSFILTKKNVIHTKYVLFVPRKFLSVI